jgi:hypothetical protein
MKPYVVLLCFLLLGLIGANLMSAMGFKESFEMASQWKDGTLSWDGPYSTPPPVAPVTDTSFFLANNRSSPECCKAATYSTGSGCVCTTKEQLNFLNMRGGNRTIEDGF